jgi:carbon-monoxide dehydrogenase medium subunit
VALQVEDGRCAEARIVLGGVSDVPVRATAAELVLVGAEPSEEAWREAGRLAASEIDPVPDIHASAEHRRELADALVVRALRKAMTTDDTGATR